MPSQSRALEASFEPSDKSPIPSGSETIPALEDFDSFFEKLNNIEQVDWRTAHPANPERKAGAVPLPGKPADKIKSSGKPSAEKADPLAGLRAAVAQAKSAQANGTDTKSPLMSKKGRKVPGAFRFAATAFVLFIVGMGIGWAALSLPAKLTGESSTAVSTTPAPSKTDGLVIEPKVTLPAKGDVNATDRTATIVPLTEVTPGDSKNDAAVLKSSDTGSADTAAKSDAPVAVDLAAAKAAGAAAVVADKPELTIANQGIQPSDDLIAGRKPETKNATSPAKATKTAAKAKPAKAAAPVATASKPAATSAQQVATGNGHYAVQVGACRSTKCVENYRTLVSTHLPANADHIRVVPVPADASGMQRVRVAPLEKSEAQQLRAALIGADPRLSNAYVVEVRP